MDFVKALHEAVSTFFSSFSDEGCKAVVETLKTWGFDYGFARTSNTTDWKNKIDRLRGTASKRVALDKYEDGGNAIIINRMQATDAYEVFLSAVHGAILASRRQAGAKTADGKERLIDEEFTRLAQYVGLIKVAETRPVEKDGKITMTKVADSSARVWFGANAGLEKVARTFAESCPALPAAYIGTEEKNNIGTIILIGKIKTASGLVEDWMGRVPSWTAAVKKMETGEEKENKALLRFNHFRNHPDISLDVKNAQYKKLLKLANEAEQQKVEEPVVPPVSDEVQHALDAVEHAVNQKEQKKPAKPIQQKKAS